MSELKNFSEVIVALDKIINWSIKNNKRIGYFAAVYKNITILIMNSANNREFEDNQLLEDLDVVFALRYIDAVKKYQENSLPTTSPWFLVFQISEKKRLTIVQNLILSISVHINYDLPIACAEVGPNEKVLKLCNDYFKLNTILSASITGIEKGIFRLSPLLSLLARVVSKLERKLLNFSLSAARSKSWESACKQAIADGAKREGIIIECQDGTNKLNMKIINPGFFANIITFIISLFEIYGVRKNIKELNKELVVIMNKGVSEVRINH